ncbi:MAG TPA: NADH-quinone oxidoreductase subunit C, partial [Devosia sp.]
MDVSEKLQTLADEAKAALGDAVLDVKFAFGELTLTVARDSIIQVVTALRDKAGFVSIVDV